MKQGISGMRREDGESEAQRGGHPVHTATEAPQNYQRRQKDRLLEIREP